MARRRATSGATRRAQNQQRGLGRLKKNIALLKVLSDQKQPKNLRSAILKHAPNELISSVGDCCRNVLNGNVSLTPKQNRQLKIHRRAIRMLAAPQISAKKKRA